jgi:hypothetical protein
MGEGYVHESAPLLFGVGKAVFSAGVPGEGLQEKTYRYRLSRTWGTSGTHATWIMLNPSTADALTDDATIRRVTAFTKAWGLDGLVVVNLFALRATDPRELRKHPDPVGAANDRFIAGAIQPWSVVVAAWGAHPLADQRSAEVMALVAEKTGAGCLGVTKGSFPRHPLYVRSDAPLVAYPPGADHDPLSLEVA